MILKIIIEKMKGVEIKMNDPLIILMMFVGGVLIPIIIHLNKNKKRENQK